MELDWSRRYSHSTRLLPRNVAGRRKDSKCATVHSESIQWRRFNDAVMTEMLWCNTSPERDTNCSSRVLTEGGIPVPAAGPELKTISSKASVKRPTGELIACSWLRSEAPGSSSSTEMAPWAVCVAFLYPSRMDLSSASQSSNAAGICRKESGSQGRLIARRRERVISRRIPGWRETLAEVGVCLCDPGCGLGQALPIGFAEGFVGEHVGCDEGYDSCFVADEVEEVAWRDAQRTGGMRSTVVGVGREERTPGQGECFQDVGGTAAGEAMDQDEAVAFFVDGE